MSHVAISNQQLLLSGGRKIRVDFYFIEISKNNLLFVMYLCIVGNINIGLLHYCNILNDCVKNKGHRRYHDKC